MSVVIRKMTEKDAARVAEICLETGLHSWSEEAFQREAVNPVAIYLLLEENSVIAGFAGIWCVADEAQVMNIGVCPEFQGRGYGKQLMSEICREAVDCGCLTMTLEVKSGNVPALALYTGMGFVETGMRKDYYPDHSDGLLMEKDLLK